MAPHRCYCEQLRIFQHVTAAFKKDSWTIIVLTIRRIAVRPGLHSLLGPSHVGALYSSNHFRHLILSFRCCRRCRTCWKVCIQELEGSQTPKEVSGRLEMLALSFEREVDGLKEPHTHTLNLQEPVLLRGSSVYLARILAQLSVRGFQRGFLRGGANLNNWGGARTGCNN